MEKHFDLQVENCREDIFKVLNNSGLQMSVLNMIVNEVQQNVNSQYMRHLQSLRQAVEVAKQSEIKGNE